MVVETTKAVNARLRRRELKRYLHNRSVDNLNRGVAARAIGRLTAIIHAEHVNLNAAQRAGRLARGQLFHAWMCGRHGPDWIAVKRRKRGVNDSRVTISPAVMRREQTLYVKWFDREAAKTKSKITIDTVAAGCRVFGLNLEGT